LDRTLEGDGAGHEVEGVHPIASTTGSICRRIRRREPTASPGALVMGRLSWGELLVALPCSKPFPVRPPAEAKLGYQA
jgi:hypothetical protein